MLHRFQRIFPNQNIAYVTADREFIEKDWLSYLVQKSIPFCIRIRAPRKIEQVAREMRV
ncbi:hypothetical protein RintRC_1097 [Richelia intracellularis]|nr:hypothetical protein RintRC_1097 [Richelia intracellularis]